MTFSEKVAFSWPSVDRFGKFLGGLMNLVQVYQISADLVNRELRNATFEGKNTKPSLTDPTLADDRRRRTRRSQNEQHIIMFLTKNFGRFLFHNFLHHARIGLINPLISAFDSK